MSSSICTLKDQTFRQRRLDPDLKQLSDSIQAIEHGARASEVPARTIATGWLNLTNAGLHEWYGVDEPTNETSQTFRNKRTWTPPLGVLVHLASHGLECLNPPGAIIWIGMQCWPYPPTLVRQSQPAQRLIQQSIFVDPPDVSSRLWAIDTALHNPAVSVVIADGSRFDMAATRRLQLAAEASHALALLARPPWETRELSAASTRWLVRSEPTTQSVPRWKLELLRCKGMQPIPEAQNANFQGWVVEWDRAKDIVVVPADVAHRVGQTTFAQADTSQQPDRKTA